MSWTIRIPTKVGKKIKLLPKAVRATLLLLMRDLELNGPSTGGGWKNYGKLKGMPGDKRHCHLMKGNPTYVCCWEVINKQLKITEVYYVGTHEKAPY
jgi:hypothetical protein